MSFSESDSPSQPEIKNNNLEISKSYLSFSENSDFSPTSTNENPSDNVNNRSPYSYFDESPPHPPSNNLRMLSSNDITNRNIPKYEIKNKNILFSKNIKYDDKNVDDEFHDDNDNDYTLNENDDYSHNPNGYSKGTYVRNRQKLQIAHVPPPADQSFGTLPEKIHTTPQIPLIPTGQKKHNVTPSLSYRLRLIADKNDPDLGFRLEKLDITFLWFMLRRFRHRTTIRKKLKRFFVWKNNTIQSKMYKLMRKKYSELVNRNLSQENTGSAHYETTLLKKRCKYLHIWLAYLESRLQYSKDVEYMRSKFKEKPNVKKHLYNWYNPYFQNCFKMLYINYKENHISDLEINYVDSWNRKFNLKKFVQKWKERCILVKQMMSYRDHLHAKRVKKADALTCKDKKFMFHAELVYFVRHQILRRALTKLTINKSQILCYFCKSDALVYLASKKNIFSNLLLGKNYMYCSISPQVNSILNEISNGLKLNCEKLYSNHWKSSFLNIAPSSYLKQNFEEYFLEKNTKPCWFLDLNLSNVKLRVSPIEVLFDHIKTLKNRLAASRPLKQQNSSTLPLFRPNTCYAVNHLEDDLTRDSLNIDFFKDFSFSDVPFESVIVSKQVQENINRTSPTVFVIRQIYLKIFGSFCITQFKRWILRARISRRLRSTGRIIRERYLKKSTSFLFHSWFNIYKYFKTVRIQIYQKTFKKIIQKLAHQKVMNIINQKAIFCLLKKSFTRFSAHINHIKSIKKIY
jgi:hypothetical protein